MAERMAAKSERRRARRVIVVGSGLSGMSTALGLAEAGVPVLLLGRTPALSSPSASDREGISAALGRQDNDEPQHHFEDTLVTGDFAADQPPVRSLTSAAPRLLGMLERSGVAFERSGDGALMRDRVTGSSGPRAARAGSSTAQQVLRALDLQILAAEEPSALDGRGLPLAGEPLVARMVPWDFVALVRDDNGVCVGAVARDLRTGKLRAFVGDAVCLATGGYASLFARTTASMLADGAGIARAFRQGALLANPELVSWQATAFPGVNKPHALPELLRTLGARLWQAKDPAAGAASEKERDYFVERTLARGALADETARAVYRAEQRLSGSDARVMLDLAAVPMAARRRLADVFAALRRWGAPDAATESIPVVAAADASLGGLWVDFEAGESGALVQDSPRNHATNVPGLYAVGSAACVYHGAARLSGNAILASLYGGSLAARAIASYRKALSRSAFDLPGSVFDKMEEAENERFEQQLAAGEEGENPFLLRDELAELLWTRCGIERADAELAELSEELEQLAERARRVTLAGSAGQGSLRALPDLVLLARAVALGARHRAECRGGHYKPDLDVRHSRTEPTSPHTTLVRWDEDAGLEIGSTVEYQCAGQPVTRTSVVDCSLLAPRIRREAAEHER